MSSWQPQVYPTDKPLSITRSCRRQPTRSLAARATLLLGIYFPRPPPILLPPRLHLVFISPLQHNTIYVTPTINNLCNILHTYIYVVKHRNIIYIYHRASSHLLAQAYSQLHYFNPVILLWTPCIRYKLYKCNMSSESTRTELYISPVFFFFFKKSIFAYSKERVKPWRYQSTTLYMMSTCNASLTPHSSTSSQTSSLSLAPTT